MNAMNPTTSPAPQADDSLEGSVINAADWPDLLAATAAETSRAETAKAAAAPARECDGCGAPFEHDGVPGRPGLLYCTPQCEADDRDDDPADAPVAAAPAETAAADDDQDDEDEDEGQEDVPDAAAGPAVDIELAALALLTQNLARAAGVVSVLVTIAPEGDKVLNESYPDPCHRDVTRVHLAADLLDNSPHLAGVQAHEIAHQVLGHSTRIRLWYWAAVGLPMLAVVGLPMVISYGLWPLLMAGLALAGICYLVDAAHNRKEERAADVLAARLLTRIGRDGWAITATAVAAAPAESRAFRMGGWLFTGQPTRRSRLRAVAAAAPGGRPSLATIAERSQTALQGNALRAVRVVAALLGVTALGPLALHGRLSQMFGLAGVPLLVVYSGIAAAALATAYNAYRGRPGPLLAYAVLAITACLTLTAALIG